METTDHPGKAAPAARTPNPARGSAAAADASEHPVNTRPSSVALAAQPSPGRRESPEQRLGAEVAGRVDEGYPGRDAEARLTGAMAAMGDPAPPQGSRSFVGRDREMAELVAGLEDAIGGRGRLFLIGGEPGVGKTWLVEQLAGHATNLGTRVLWGRCWEGGGTPPFWPWGQVIGALADDRDEQTFASWLGATGTAQVAQLVPGLADRLGTASIPEAPSHESDASRFYLFEAVTGLLRRAASAQPLVLVFDDLHAADEPSLLLLQFLARELHGVRLLVVGTYRDLVAERFPGIGEAVGELVREGQLLNLRGLDLGAVKALIETLSGVVASPARVAAVHDTTEGNPLFVREVVRLLAAQAALERPGQAVPIPGTIRAVIGRRLAPLSSDAVQVLSAAAVIGREFDLELVGPACELPVERILAALSEAVALGVAEEPGTVEGYRFSHSLMREVLYERLPIPVRIQLHQRVGEAIERVYGTGAGAHIAELARHFGEVAAAGEAAKALVYARLAGERAMGMYAYEEAAAQYQRALQALRFAGPDEAGRCELLLRLGAAQARAGDYQQARGSCLQAAEIARRLGAPEQLARAALGFGERQVEGGLVNRELVALLQEALDGLGSRDAPLRARLLARLSVEFVFSDEAKRMESLSLEALAMARRLADPAALRSAVAARWMAVWGPDGLEERTALAAEILHLAQETGDRELELDGHAHRAASSLESGDARAVEADIATHARLTEELPMAVHRWAATTMRALRALLHGSFEDAERLANEALSLQPGRPNVMFTHIDQLALLRWEQGRLGELRDDWQAVADQFPLAAFAGAWLSLADAELGHREDARRGLWSLTEQLPRRPRDGTWLPAVALASLLAAHLNEPGAAGSLYPLLLPYAGHVVAFTAPHPVVCLGSAALYLGLLATVRSSWTEAAAHFEAAITAHDRLGARPLLARTRHAYAGMLLARGQAADRGRALALLDRALPTADTLGMAAVAEDTRRLRAAQAGEDVPAEPVAAEAAEPEASRNLFRREGEYWTVGFEGVVVRLRDAKGLRHLARLLAQPGQEVPAVALEAAEGHPAPAAVGSSLGRAATDLGVVVRGDLGDAGVWLDAGAKAAYRARLVEVRSELAEAEGHNDLVRVARARVELEFLVAELARAVGLGGRDRRAAAHAERARLNATRAIRAAMANVARAHPGLGRHLAATVRTGRYCAYVPDPRLPIRWES
jgi:tetratricopeptide (TPR) repeat protein